MLNYADNKLTKLSALKAFGFRHPFVYCFTDHTILFNKYRYRKCIPLLQRYTDDTILRWYKVVAQLKTKLTFSNSRANNRSCAFICLLYPVQFILCY